MSLDKLKKAWNREKIYKIPMYTQNGLLSHRKMDSILIIIAEVFLILTVIKQQSILKTI